MINMTKRVHGFTTVEVLMALVVLGILAALAVPSLTNFANEQRLTGAINVLAADLQYARAEAIKRNSRVLVCARTTAGATSCTGAATLWQNGWVVCYAAASGTDCDTTNPLPDGSQNPMRKTSALNPRVRLTTTTPLIGFTPTGATSNSGGVTLSLNGDWTTSTTRTATIATTGAVTVRKTSP